MEKYTSVSAIEYKISENRKIVSLKNWFGEGVTRQFLLDRRGKRVDL